MNREILHKGISKTSGKWIEGDLVHDAYNGYKFIEIGIQFDHNYPIEIVEGTDCQFTGKSDKKGKKIFEGDYDKDGNVVVWCENGWEFGALDIPTKEIVINCHACEGNFLFGDHIGDFEVIGNINDK